MLTVDHPAQLRELHTPVHWAMGFFDGVHLGHRRVIQAPIPPETLRGALTFDRHPLELLRPEQAPLLLTPDARQKEKQLSAAGVDVLLRLPFTPELAAMSPADFLDMLASACPIAGASVGANWRFGRDGLGTPALLRQLGAQRGFGVHIQELARVGECPVSSSRIRSALAEGRLHEVEMLLGRPFGIEGEVEHGQKLARKLGFPTANVRVAERAALPPYGVYRVLCRWGGEAHLGIANLGLRPTVAEDIKRPRLEVHLPGWQGELYGRRLSVELLELLRPEQKFPSIDALKEQMQRDISALGLG